MNNLILHEILIPLLKIIINYICMANLNRIKLVLVEKNKTGNGWLMNLAKHHVLSVNGVKIVFSLI